MITCKCDKCGAKFQVSCEAELKAKIAAHRCRLPNKRVIRTEQLGQQQIQQIANDVATNQVEKHNFNKLVKKK